MKLVGFDRIQDSISQPGFSFKVVLNETAAIFLRIGDQHRDFKVEGVSYEDDYAGNALAATVSEDRIDIRFHRAFSDERARGLALLLLSAPEMEFVNGTPVYYQGRKL